MKFFIVMCALVACTSTAPAREKRGFLSGLHSADVYNHYPAPLVSFHEPAAEVVSVHKVVNSHHVVDVPEVVNVHKVVSVPEVVSVNKVVAAPSYVSYSNDHDFGYGSGWNSDISSLW